MRRGAIGYFVEQGFGKPFAPADRLSRHAMFLSDVDYFTRRALTQLDCAAVADDPGVARVHVRLSDLYLERARALMGRELNQTMIGIDA